MRSSLLSRGVPLATALWLLGCSGARGPEWPPQAQKWFDRADHSYRTGDIGDAEHAVDQALKALPGEAKVRILAAEIALAGLEYGKVLELTRGLEGPEASGLRGRAYWYLGEIERAADELDALNANPEVRDPWAAEVAQLARLGRGRRPFEISGGLVTAVDMPRAGTTAMIVPLEINGEQSLALIATDSSETVIDSPSRESAWVSLRFGETIEVSDVPVLGRDLSGIKRELGAPIKMLIGVNLLRHLRPTVDFAGRQFVVRTFDPPAPPEATTLHPIYYRGGALTLSVSYGADPTSPSGSLLMHTSMNYPIALDGPGWEKSGLDPKTFPPIPGAAGLKEGRLPFLRLGAFDMPGVPGVLGAPIAEVEKATRADLDGFAGSGLFATFRLTLADGGRTLWVEDLPPDVIEARRQSATRTRGPAPTANPGQTPPAPLGNTPPGNTSSGPSSLPPPPPKTPASANPR